MKCIIYILFSYFVSPILTYKTNLNKTLQFGTLEKIVKTGIRRFCDQQEVNVFKKCKRPLVWVSDFDSDFDLHTKVGRTVAEVLGLKIDNVNNRLCDEIKKDLSIVESCQIIHEGLNIKLKDGYILDQLDLMLDDERLAVPKLTDENIVLDYFSPNVGKMLHMGHMRSLVIGHSLGNLLEFSGSRVHRRSHVGDFGLQCGILMRYLMEYDIRVIEALDVKKHPTERYMKTLREEMNYMIPEREFDYIMVDCHLPEPFFADKLIFATIDSYYKLACDKFQEDDEFNKRARYEAMLLQNSKSCAQLHWDKLRSICIGHYEDVADLFYMNRLKTIPESYYKTVTEKLINKLINSKKVTQQGKEVLLDLLSLEDPKQEEKQESQLNIFEDVIETAKPEDGEEFISLDGEETSVVDPKNVDSISKAVLRTADGSLTYMATDLGALSHRVNWNKPDRIIYVTDKNQKPHFEKLYKISKRLKLLKGCNIEHIGFGQVTLEGVGRLRSRSGNNCRFVDVAKQVFQQVGDELVNNGDYLKVKRPTMAVKIGTGSMIFSDLSVDRADDYNFSMERIMNQGNNSLVAILYSYVRSLSIQNKAENLETIGNREFRSDTERKLARTLLGFETMIISAVATRGPHHICKYLLTLSKDFNRFYKDTHVIEGNKVYLQSLKLVRLTSRVIEKALKILNIRPVHRL